MNPFIEITHALASSNFRVRRKDSHKGTHGHALLIAGDTQHMGAALISAKACLRSGAGLLTVCIPEQERLVFQIGLPEAMVCFQEQIQNDFAKYNSLGIGPGIGASEKSLYILKNCICFFTKRMVIDADALNLLSKNLDLLNQLPEQTILTPHPKEFDRLFGTHNNLEERIITAKKISEKQNLIIVLKGHQTLVFSKNQIFQNTTGNSGLAKGGSGDALTGIITSLLAQDYTPETAACLAVYIHGKAADYTLLKQSVESMLITDIIENLGMVFADFSK